MVRRRKSTSPTCSAAASPSRSPAKAHSATNGPKSSLAHASNRPTCLVRRPDCLEIDRAALRGSGAAPEPRGVLNTSAVTVTAHGANGSVNGSPPAAGTIGWEFLVQSVGAARNLNFEPNAQVFTRYPTDLKIQLVIDPKAQCRIGRRRIHAVEREGPVTGQVASAAHGAIAGGLRPRPLGTGRAASSCRCSPPIRR